MVDFSKVPKLTVLTYTAWKKSISLALAAENCLKIVDGTELEPDPPTYPTGPPAPPTPENPFGGDPTNPTEQQIIRFEKAEDRFEKKLHSFKTREGKAAWMISQTLGEGVDSHIKDTGDPFIMWGNLKTAMDTRDNPIHQRAIRKKFSDLVHNGKGTIDEYIAKLKEFQRAMEGTQDPISDTALVNKILTTLPKDWDVKLRAIEDDPDLSLVKLERILRNFQVVISENRKPDDIALAAKAKRTPGKGKKKGGKPVDKKVTEG